MFERTHSHALTSFFISHHADGAAGVDNQHLGLGARGWSLCHLHVTAANVARQ